MNTKEYIVRLVKPASKPYLPKIKKTPSANSKKKTNPFLNILTGSGIGFAAGIAVYFMLKFVGINFGGLESSLIIGLPALFGLLTSFVVF